MQRRACTVFMVLAALLPQACRSSVAPPASGPRPRTTVRIRSEVPFVLHVDGEQPGVARCEVTSFQGYVGAVAGDTLTFSMIDRFEPASPPGTCRVRGSVYIVTREVKQGRTEVRRVSWVRTGIAIVVGLPVAALLLFVIVCEGGDACFA